jgi:hypothetical protein
MATAGSTRPAGSACLAYRRTGAVPMLARRERFARAADPWVIGLRRRRPSLVVAVALANKTARIAWAVMQQESCSGGNDSSTAYARARESPDSCCQPTSLRLCIRLFVPLRDKVTSSARPTADSGWGRTIGVRRQCSASVQHVTYRGAGPALTLLEAGAALAAGKRVFVVSPDWWSFANHPRCRVLKDVASAIEAIMGKKSGRRCNSVEVASGGKSYQGKSARVADTRVARTASQCSKQAVSKRQKSKSNRDVVASSISAAEADRWCRFDVLPIPKFRKVKTVGAWRQFYPPQNRSVDPPMSAERRAQNVPSACGSSGTLG